MAFSISYQSNVLLFFPWEIVASIYVGDVYRYNVEFCSLSLPSLEPSSPHMQIEHLYENEIFRVTLFFKHISYWRVVYIELLLFF